MVHTMSPFEQAVTKFYSDENISSLQGAVVGILGAGGLGSNCAVHLVRSGVSQLVITDYDVVEMSNLN